MKLYWLALAVTATLALPAPGVAQGGTPTSDPTTRVTSVNNSRGSAAAPRWGFAIGMKPGPNNSYTHPFVHTVVPGTNADRAGIEVGDIILSVNGRDTREPGQLFPVREPGTRYVLRVRRGTEELELTFIYPERRAPADSSGAPQPAAATAPGGSRNR